MIGVKRVKNLCLWRQSVYIAVTENIVTSRRKRHAYVGSIAWRFVEYILKNVLLFSGYLVFTVFVICYFENICFCWLYSLTIFSTATAPCCFLAIPERIRPTNLRPFSDLSKQSKAWPLYGGISARTGWVDYDGIGSCWPVAVKVFFFSDTNLSRWIITGTAVVRSSYN